MVEVLTCSLMETNTLASTRMANQMDKVSTLGQMEITTKDNFLMVLNRVKENGKNL